MEEEDREDTGRFTGGGMTPRKVDAYVLGVTRGPRMLGVFPSAMMADVMSAVKAGDRPALAMRHEPAAPCRVLLALRKAQVRAARLGVHSGGGEGKVHALHSGEEEVRADKSPAPSLFLAY